MKIFAHTVHYQKFMLLLILLTGAFVRFYQIDSLIPFISDQAWFYWSAKLMLNSGNIPLVGITSSHPWLHQGALWTYMLAGVLPLFSFSPVSGAFLTASLDLLTVFLMYYLGKQLFSENVGLIAAFLYASSPLVILSSRTAYHTSPIPLFTVLLMIALSRWINGNIYFVPIIIGLLGILYNFEIATISLSIVFILLFVYGYYRQRKWINIFNKKNIFYSLLAYLLSMSSMIIYDFGHGFPQTIKIIFWIVYKIISGLGLYRLHPSDHIDWPGFFYFLSLHIKRLIFMQNGYVALFLLIISFIYISNKANKELHNKKGKEEISYILLFLSILVPSILTLTGGIISFAYLPVLFAPIILMLAFFLSQLMHQKFSRYIILGVIIYIGFINIELLLKSGYFTSKAIIPERYNVVPLMQEEQLTNAILAHAKQTEFSIKNIGSSAVDNYSYLVQLAGKKLTYNAHNIYTVQPLKKISSNAVIIYKNPTIMVTYEKK